MMDWQTTRKPQVFLALFRIVLLVLTRDSFTLSDRQQGDSVAGRGRLSCTKAFSGKPILVMALMHDADALLRPVLQNKGG
ncbi:hypothetical protein [Deinococcus roseus]|nr:hypothetical protein [Deinococcus roseus]